MSLVIMSLYTSSEEVGKNGLTIDIETPPPRCFFCEGASYQWTQREGDSPNHAHDSIVFATFSREWVSPAMT